MLDGWATTQPCGDFPAVRAATVISETASMLTQEESASEKQW